MVMGGSCDETSGRTIAGAMILGLATHHASIVMAGLVPAMTMTWYFGHSQRDMALWALRPKTAAAADVGCAKRRIFLCETL
jgi:hypothetical protein